jgi:hypothetical protein
MTVQLDAGRRSQGMYVTGETLNEVKREVIQIAVY